MDKPRITEKMIMEEQSPDTTSGLEFTLDT